MSGETAPATGATIGDWLHEVRPTPPPRLAARVAEAIGARAAGPRVDAPTACLAAGESLLRDLLARPSAGRESALDLLTIDALVTYAFEAASIDPNLVHRLAQDAMTRLATAAVSTS